MLKCLVTVALTAFFVFSMVRLGDRDSAAQEPGSSGRRNASTLTTEDHAALELGRKVIAIKRTIEDPSEPNAISVVTDLGLDQRYYVMVRGWLSEELRGAMSILEASKDRKPVDVAKRVAFLKKAIRAIDLE